MPTTPLEIIIALLLLGWLLLSLLNQSNFKCLGIVRDRDHLGVLPEWKFFQRDSGQWDYHLLYRDRDAEGQMSGWVEVPITEDRAPYHFVWNPDKRSTKVLTDIASALVGSDWRGQTVIMLSIPYLLLLNAVCRHAAARTPVERQFMIVRTSGRGATTSPQVLFRSLFHRVD